MPEVGAVLCKALRGELEKVLQRKIRETLGADKNSGAGSNTKCNTDVAEMEEGDRMGSASDLTDGRIPDGQDPEKPRGLSSADSTTPTSGSSSGNGSRNSAFNIAMDEEERAARLAMRAVRELVMLDRRAKQ